MKTKYHIGYVFKTGAVITDGPMLIDEKARKYEVECPNCKTRDWKFSNTLLGLKHPCKKCYDNSMKRTDTLPAKKAAWRSLVSNAKARGYSVEITFDEFVEVAEQNCFYCSQEPQPRPGPKSWQQPAMLNGIDRVDNHMGYLKENIVSCCSQCNWAKKDLTIEEWQAWIKRLVEKHECYTRRSSPSS